MNRAVIVIAAVLVVAIGAFAVNMSSGAPAGTATAPVEFDGMDDMNTLANLAQPAVQGNPEARIRIIEFGDYGCPACAGFYSTVKPQIELAYGDNEDVAFVYYDFPILQAHPHAFVAARAARCAGDQNMYWEYHGQLFENQRSWSLAASTPLGELESPRFGHLGHHRPHRAGTHRPHGFLLACGPGIAAGETVRGGSVLDIAPSMLALLNEAVQQQMVGRSLLELRSGECEPE